MFRWEPSPPAWELFRVQIQTIWPLFSWMSCYHATATGFAMLRDASRPAQDVSTNGTYLNGKRLPRPPFKNPADRLMRLRSLFLVGEQM